MSDNPIPDQKPKWYQTTWSLVAAFALLGPLALPMLWTNPRIPKFYKVVWTLVVLMATWWMVDKSAQIIGKILDQYKEIGLIQ